MKYKVQSLILISCILFLIPVFTSGQVALPLPVKNIREPLETLGDKYLPNPFNNQRTSPARKFKRNPGTNLINSSIFTTQVNVDAAQQNIIFDAGNEPNIAMNPLNPNQIVIGWRQFDNVNSSFRQAGNSYSTDGGQTWNFHTPIDFGVFRSDPVLDFDSSGNFYYNSLTIDTAGNYVCKVFRSTDGGVTWNNGTPAGGGDKQWMAIDRTDGVGRGNIYSFWSAFYSSCPPDGFTRSTDGDSTYENCTYVDGDPSLGTMAIGINGELYICGADTNHSGLIVSKSLNAQIAGSTIVWQSPTLVSMDGSLSFNPPINPSGLLGQANIDVDRSNGPGQGNVYILASINRFSNFDPGDIMFAKSTDGGVTFGPPIRVNDDVSDVNSQWLGTMSVAPNGRIDAIWLDTRDQAVSSDSSALYYSFSTDQGDTWSANEKLSDSFDPHLGYPSQLKMGDYFDMISDNTGAHLAWTNTILGEENVYYSYIIPSLNTNVLENSAGTIYSVFPNPTKGEFVITCEARQSSIQIYNALGKKLYSQAMFKTKNDFDITSQPAGIYFLKIMDENGSVVIKKLVKE